MAYWHFCTACQQWSKSANPLNDDKACSFCGKKYNKLAKKNDETTVTTVEDVLIETEMTETVKEIVADDTLAATEEIEEYTPEETVEDQEALVSDSSEIIDTPEETVATEAVEETDVSAATEISGESDSEETTEFTERNDAPKNQKTAKKNSTGYNSTRLTKKH